ncbi:MAG: hypothetical protein ACRDRJ_47190 [Streptosporangiaceae bacterium]
MSAGLTTSGVAGLHAVAQRFVGGDLIPGLVALVARGEHVHVDALGTLAVDGPLVWRDSRSRRPTRSTWPRWARRTRAGSPTRTPGSPGSARCR